MKSKLLLPHNCRIIGAILLPFSIALLIATYSYNYSIPFLNTGIVTQHGPITEKIDLTGTVAMISVFICLFMIAFSREKQEDEYVRSIRLGALQISVYVNYLVLGIATLTIYGINFLMVMEINLFTILVIFIIIYYYQLHIQPRFKSTAA